MIATTDRPRIAAGTRMGVVALTVRDLERSTAFYRDVLGLVPGPTTNGAVRMYAGDEALVELVGDPSAPVLDHRATGLFHLAILVPGRAALAEALLRVAQARWQLDGAADHHVSEALYLSDPDGNGIEIYRDRPRGDWPHQQGQLRMPTLPLDLDDVLAELSAGPGVPPPIDSDTTIGHVHLQVSELERSEAFWNGAIGFDVVVREYPGALFVSAGGYHHHLGLNTWNSAGRSAPEAGAVGLRSFEILLPEAKALDEVIARLHAAGVAFITQAGRTIVHDPSGNTAHLRVAS